MGYWLLSRAVREDWMETRSNNSPVWMDESIERERQYETTKCSIYVNYLKRILYICR